MSNLAKQYGITPERLRSLSQGELYELYLMLNDYKKLKEQRRTEDYFKNAHQGQMRFHKAHNRIRIFLGGNRSGKTTAGTNEMYLRVSGKHQFKTCPVPIKALIVAQDFTTHVKDIIEPKIKEWFPPGFIKNVDTNHAKAWSKIYCKNGSIIDIKTHDQDLKVFEGSDYDYVWFDEPPPEAIFKAVWRGLTDREGECAITGTPIVEPWMFDKVAEADAENMQGLVWYQYINTYENVINIGDGDKEAGLRRIKALESMYDDDEKMARIEGKFLHLKGLIFKHWSRKDHLIEPFPWPNHWPIIFSVDPHPRKPWAISFVGLTEHKRKILLHSELVPGVIDDVAQRAIQIRNEEIEMARPNSKPKIIRSWIDNYASVELMEKTNKFGDKIKVIDEFNDAISPYIPKCRPAPKDVHTKIQIMKSWLKPKETAYGMKPDFYVFDNAANTGKQSFVYEIEHYRWASYTGKQKQKLKDQPVKEDDDILDTVMQVALAEGHGKQESALGEKKEPIKYAGRRR